jgi:hypothetical protein
MNRGIAEQIVFVPELGFRPADTRVLPEPAAATLAGTTVTILAVAAGPGQTDVVVEWAPPELPEGPDNWVLWIDRSGVHQRPPPELDTLLVVGSKHHAPNRIEHRFRSGSGYDLRELTFPPLGGGVEGAELRVVRADQEWRVPFTLAPSDFRGAAALCAMDHEGISLRATAVARRGNRIVIDVDGRTGDPRAHVSTLGRDGGPGAFPARLTKTPPRKPAFPVVLEDGQGRQSPELSRMRHISRTPDLTSVDNWPLRISSIFEWPDEIPASLRLRVPCVVIGERAEAVVVDLRALPAEIQLGGHRLRVLRAEPSPEDPPRTRIVFQAFEPAGARHFLGPGSLIARGMPADLSKRGEPDEQQLVWIDTIVPDEPIVTLRGAVVRIDGPWILPIPLS